MARIVLEAMEVGEAVSRRAAPDRMKPVIISGTANPAVRNRRPDREIPRRKLDRPRESRALRTPSRMAPPVPWMT